MNNSIKNIFNQNKLLIYQIEKTVYYFRIQNYDLALRISANIINQVSDNIKILFSKIKYFNENQMIVEPDNVLGLLNSLLNAQKNQDYVLLADLYELDFIPFFISIQETIISKEDNTDPIKYNLIDDYYTTSLEAINNIDSSMASIIKSMPHPSNILGKDYEIEYTSSGFITLALTDKGKKYYLHSNKNAPMEAFHLARSWYNEDKDTYLVYGYGLSYHIWELFHLDETIHLEIYESDINILRLGCAYTEIELLATHPNIKLIYDPDFKQLFTRLGNMNNNMEFVIHHPSLRNIKNPSIRDKLEDYFIYYSSIKNQAYILNNNFKINIQYYNDSIDSLKDIFTGKNLFIIAAGPSLDKNFIQLKGIKKDKSIILATGTVFKKLIYSGIIPDYVIITDANPRIYGQIAGEEARDIPMLLISTANKDFAKNYQGKKFLICQHGYPKAEEFAKEHGCNLYNTGGSVSTTALDIGIQFGCKRIIFLGLDLSYTDNFVHAEGTSRRNVENTDGLIPVTDIYGKQIYTTRVLNIYRKWIEDRIRNVKGIEFIDATEGGARIDGMRIAKLSEVVDN